MAWFLDRRHDTASNGIAAEQPMSSDATQIQTFFVVSFSQCGNQCVAKRWRPVALQRQQSAENVLEFLGRIDPARVGNGEARALQSPNTRYLIVGVAHLIGVDCLLRLENGIDAFGRYDRLTLIAENERRILPIEYNHVDLVAESARTIDDMGRRCAIALGQVSLQQLQPDRFASVALRAGMRECPTHRRELLLNVVVQP